MQLLNPFAPFDLRVILVHLAKALLLLGWILAVPCLYALGSLEYQYGLLFGGLAVSTWLLGRLALHLLPAVRDLEPREAIVVTAMTYLLFAGVGSLAFWQVAGPLDGLFEAMSGFTTTGLSVFGNTQLPKSLFFFRAYSQWIGGIGIIVLSLVIMGSTGRTAQQLYASEFGAENFLGNVVETARLFIKIYLVLSLLGFLLFWAAGMPMLDALLNMMTSLSTGGFSHYRESIGHYGEAPLVRAAVMLLMTIGAISLPLYYQALVVKQCRFWHDRQLLWFLGIILIALLAGIGSSSQDFSAILFHLLSSLSTTGYCLTEPVHWDDSLLLLSILLMVIGGASFSTAGGIKLFRLIIGIKVIGWVIRRRLLAEEFIKVVKYEDWQVPDQEIMEIAGFLALYLLLLAVSTLAFTMAGHPLVPSLFECVSALGTVGLSAGITGSGLDGGLKLLLIFDMWAGRLEIVPVLLLLNPAVWLPLRRKS